MHVCLRPAIESQVKIPSRVCFPHKKKPDEIAFVGRCSLLIAALAARALALHGLQINFLGDLAKGLQIRLDPLGGLSGRGRLRDHRHV